MQMEGLHIWCAYQMAWMHQQKRGPANSWTYPASSDVLTECGLQTIEEYVQRWRQSITAWVVDRLLFVAYWGGENGYKESWT